VFHAAEHLSDCGKVLFQDKEEQRCWFEVMRLLLLQKGCGGAAPLLQILERDVSLPLRQRRLVRRLRRYFWNNRGRLCYAERLREGRAIGSGVVEGRAKIWQGGD
jgi:hypothetical protein